MKPVLFVYLLAILGLSEVQAQTQGESQTQEDRWAQAQSAPSNFHRRDNQGLRRQDFDRGEALGTGCAFTANSIVEAICGESSSYHRGSNRDGRRGSPSSDDCSRAAQDNARDTHDFLVSAARGSYRADRETARKAAIAISCLFDGRDAFDDSMDDDTDRWDSDNEAPQRSAPSSRSRRSDDERYGERIRRQQSLEQFDRDWERNQNVR